ncbi:hypothetical protein HPB51_023410 [Rhipicephalus microplus]|uniref:Uncharacterized protein n=1 Tax=Rhipicephalus microplus TaxID=6941 RepID=A0A9J6DX74_RHIMP|nr:hypothetical protein HPB51_023410 [Rhipicephalus microplus]
MNQLKIRGRIHPFNAYVAAPEDLLRGIIHGLPPGTTQADLMANLRTRTQGVKIERATMLGSSKSAIITFTGDVLPSSDREEAMLQKRQIQLQIMIKIEVNIKEPATAKHQQACGGSWRAKLEENTEQQLGKKLRPWQERRRSSGNHWS